MGDKRISDYVNIGALHDATQEMGRRMKLSHVGFVAALGISGTLTACGADSTLPQSGINDTQGSTSPTTATQANDAAKVAPDDFVDKPQTYGGDYGIRPAYEECITHQSDGTSTAGHRQGCAEEELGFQNARLNRVLDSAMGMFPAQGDDDITKASHLRNAQHAWLSRVEKMCAEATDNAGSIFGPAAQATCLMDQIAMRASQLERKQTDMAAGIYFRNSYDQCAETSHGVTGEILDCIASEFEYQDGRLNEMYRKLLAKLSGSQRNSLVGEQRRWLSKKEQECKWHPETEGQGQLIDAMSCELNLTTARANELHRRGRGDGQ
ncbi:DUF1311 domain-containing protein [Luteimonas sp. SX5]|uniref:DUF1311 domain-containing protein n=1 Tax=Luteimonas galliterrae TaxID=2940486 RepID=A0ABT0MLG3_9GAMM|nr:lysozyme inhibitor LprI family protein [Luteimonas galliterrae]MCL1635731.1 DUF1311 domain-containing protein [Luteimonas galliterrae]